MLTKLVDGEVVELTAEQEAEVRAQWARPLPALTYRQLRAAEYPPIADYVDGIVKGDTAQVDAYIAACLAVKAKYPNP